MSISIIYILDDKGTRLVFRDFRGDVDIKCIEVFEKMLFETADTCSIKPVFNIDDNDFIFMKFNFLYLVAVSTCNTNVMMIMNFLRTLAKLLEECVGKFTSDAIVKDIAMVINLIDETMDFGYPQFTESKPLKSYLSRDFLNIFGRSAPTITPIAVRHISWRPEGIKYRKNEIFIDVIEKVNLITNSNGSIITNDICGTFLIKSYLSGMPEVKVGFNDRMLIKSAEPSLSVRSTRQKKSIDLQDVKFHQCVRLDAYEKDRQITFIPPDGKFDLLTYRAELDTPPPFWVDAQVKIVSKKYIIYDIQLKSVYGKDYIATYADVRISVPKECYSPNCKASVGTIEYTPEEDCMIWKLQAFRGKKDAKLYASLNIPSTAADQYEKYNTKINLNFEICGMTASGIRVRYLKVIEPSNYVPLCWIRYLIKDGTYEFRTH